MNHRTTSRRRLASPFCTLVLACVLAGCSSSPNRAPVEDRTARQPTAAAALPPASAPAASSPAAAMPAKSPPGVENAGKPGYYTVRPGDTMARIALDSGQTWRDIARWNGIDNPNVIEVGQVLRVQPPTSDANGVVVRPVAPGGRVESHGAPVPASAASGSAVPASAAPAPMAQAAPASAPARDPDDDLVWAWPAAGPIAVPFDEAKNKGLAITGKAGDPVFAAADGRVVYAGSGLRGYGNLVIVKHNATYLSAYAHNQTLLVKEEQVVRRGQKIAEMGSSDADRVQLHFEIRRQGKPVDPAKLLPPR